jgi:hypothetical protein
MHLLDHSDAFRIKKIVLFYPPRRSVLRIWSFFWIHEILNSCSLKDLLWIPPTFPHPLNETLIQHPLHTLCYWCYTLLINSSYSGLVVWWRDWMLIIKHSLLYSRFIWFVSPFSFKLKLLFWSSLIILTCNGWILIISWGLITLITNSCCIFLLCFFLLISYHLIDWGLLLLGIEILELLRICLLWAALIGCFIYVFEALCWYFSNSVIQISFEHFFCLGIDLLVLFSFLCEFISRLGNWLLSTLVMRICRSCI